MRTQVIAAGPAQLPIQVGSHFAGYRVLDLIGQGGHACVFRVHDEFLDKHFALKVLYRAGGVTPEMVQRGQTEAKFLSSVRHPHIVEVVRAGIEQGLVFIVMELLEGRSLRLVQHLAGRLEVEEVLQLAAQVADALAFAHEHKALHRDLKPDNVFVCRQNQAKVLDFGIAKLVDGSGWQTRHDLVVGTMLYMSPEQVQGMPLGPASDVYSLGLMMYTALLGKHPCLLESDSPSNEELLRMQVLRVPPRLDQLAPHIPADVAQLVAHSLTKAPEERIPSMAAFAHGIRSALERYIGEARRSGIALRSRDLATCPFDGSPVAQPLGAGPATRTDTIYGLQSPGAPAGLGPSPTSALSTGDRTAPPVGSWLTGGEQRQQISASASTGKRLALASGGVAILGVALLLTVRAWRSPTSDDAATDARVAASSNVAPSSVAPSSTPTVEARGETEPLRAPSAALPEEPRVLPPSAAPAPAPAPALTAPAARDEVSAVPRSPQSPPRPSSTKLSVAGTSQQAAKTAPTSSAKPKRPFSSALPSSGL